MFRPLVTWLSTTAVIVSMILGQAATFASPGKKKKKKGKKKGKSKKDKKSGAELIAASLQSAVTVFANKLKAIDG